MQVVSSESIILRNQDFREQDRLVTFLTPEHGRLTGVARGARKLTARGVASYELFSRGTIYFVEGRNSDLVTIRKCDPLPPHLFLQRDPDKFLYAGYMAELIHLCPINPAEAARFFQLLAKGLAALAADDPEQNLPLLRLDFELDFLVCLGLQPEWNQCCVCGRPLFLRQGKTARPLVEGALQFDPAQGGLRCPDCLGSGGGMEKLSVGSVAFLLAWRAPDRPPNLLPTRNALRELGRVIAKHLIHHLEREPRTLALLPKV